jgi:hypothetical protein
MEEHVLFADDLQQKFVILFKRQVEGALLNLWERSVSWCTMPGNCIKYLSGGERTEYSLDLRVLIVLIVFLLVVFIIVSDFNRAHVRELHRGAPGGICKFSTKSGVRDDQVALWNDGNGVSRLNDGTPSITLSLETCKSKLLCIPTRGRLR